MNLGANSFLDNSFMRSAWSSRRSMDPKESKQKCEGK